MRPYRVLASDDEQIVLDSFAWILGQEFPGRLELYTARNGLDAIRLAAEIKPDLFLMDILMPGINGLETIRQLRGTHPLALFVVLSAHGEFSFAQEAVRLSVFDYLLKPIERRKLVETLEAALARLKDRDQTSLRQVVLQDRLERMEPAVEQAFVHAASDYRSLPANLEYLLPLFQKGGRAGFFFSLSLGTASPDSSVRAAFRDFAKRGLECLVGPWGGNRVSVYCLSGDASSVELVVSQFSDWAAVTCRVGVGRAADTPEAIHDSYRESLWALAASDEPGVFDSTAVRVPAEAQATTHRRGELLSLIQAGRTSEAHWSFDEFVRVRRAVGGENEPSLRWAVLEVLILAKNAAAGESEPVTDTLSSLLDPDVDKMPLESWLSLCHQVVDRFCARPASAAATVDNPATRAKKFLEESFSQELGVDDVAAAVGVSSGYLSHIFRQEVGGTVLDYLTGLRVNRARELLQNSNHSIKQIAGMVGYRDPNYLSRVFRLRTGITLTAFRRGA